MANNNQVAPIELPFGFPPKSAALNLFCQPLVPAPYVIGIHPKYEAIFHTLACFHQVPEQVHFVLNGPLNPNLHYFDSARNVLNNAGVYGFQDMNGLFGDMTDDNFPPNPQFNSVIYYVASSLGAVDPVKAIDFVHNLPIDSVVYADVSNVSAPSNTPGMCGLFYEPFTGPFGVKMLTAKYKCGRVKVEYDYSVLRNRPWFYDTTAVIWRIVEVGPKMLIKFKHVPVCPPPAVYPHIPEPVAIPVSFADVLTRAPFDTVSKDVGLYNISKSWVYQFVGNHYYFFPRQLLRSPVPTSQFVLPKTLVEHLKLEAVGMPRNSKTYETLIGIAHRMYVSAGMKYSNPSQILTGSVIFAMYDGVVDELNFLENHTSSSLARKLDAAVKALDGGVPDKKLKYAFLSLFPLLGLYKLYSKYGLPKFTIPLLRLTFGGHEPIYHPAVGAGVLLPVIRTVVKLALAAAKPLAVIAASVFLANKFVFHGPPNPPIVVHNICPKEFVPDTKPIDSASTITVAGADYTNTILPPTACRRKIAAQLAGFGVKNRLPVYSCQCPSALYLAFRTRMAMPLAAPTQIAIENYRLAMNRLFKSIACYEDGQNIDARTNGTVPACYQIHPMTFSQWAADFPGPKREMYAKALDNLFKGTAIISYKREMFVKFEPYMKHNGTTVSTFDPRLIIKFDPTYNVTVGPFLKAFGNLMKGGSGLLDHEQTGLFPCVTIENMHQCGFVNPAIPRRYTYASGLDAADVGRWFTHWSIFLDDGRIAPPMHGDDSQWTGIRQMADLMLADYQNGYVAVAVEVDGSRFDGHKHAAIKVVHNWLISRFFPAPLSTQLFRHLTATLDTDVRVKTEIGEVKCFSAGRQQSGHVNTSVDNTLQVMGMTEEALFNLENALRDMGLELWQIFAAIIALGDDMAALLFLPRRAVPMIAEYFTNAYAAYGHVAEVQVYTGQNIGRLSFCSGYFYPVIRQGHQLHLWAPKIGRVLSRLSWSKDPDVRPEDFIYSVLQGYSCLMPAIPVLSAFYHTLVHILHKKGAKLIQLPREYEAKFNTKLRGFKIDTSNYTKLDTVLGYYPGSIAAAEYHISTLTDFTLIDHYSVEHIVDVDCPVKRTDEIGKFIVDPVLGAPKPTLADIIRFKLTSAWGILWEKGRQHWGYFARADFLAFMKSMPVSMTSISATAAVTAGAFLSWDIWDPREPVTYNTKGPHPIKQAVSLLVAPFIDALDGVFHLVPITMTAICCYFHSQYIGPQAWFSMLTMYFGANYALFGAPYLEEAARQIDSYFPSWCPPFSIWITLAETDQALAQLAAFYATTNMTYYEDVWTIFWLSYKIWTHCFHIPSGGDYKGRVIKHWWFNQMAIIFVDPLFRSIHNMCVLMDVRRILPGVAIYVDYVSLFSFSWVDSFFESCRAAPQQSKQFLVDHAETFWSKLPVAGRLLSSKIFSIPVGSGVGSLIQWLLMGGGLGTIDPRPK